jgi:hypothetical protein
LHDYSGEHARKEKHSLLTDERERESEEKKEKLIRDCPDPSRAGY